MENKKFVTKSLVQEEDSVHWADLKEIVSSSKPLKLTFAMVKYLPKNFVYLLVFPISFFYFICAKRARFYAKEFQIQVKQMPGKSRSLRINTFAPVFSFALAIVEKLEGWLGKFSEKDLCFHDDGRECFVENLKNGKGSIVFCSHLGNIELLRSVSNYEAARINREIPITIIMEMKTSQEFNKILMGVNKKSSINIITADDIGPEAIEKIEETVVNGGLVVFAGDRISSNEMTRKRRIQNLFLGKNAGFPYGAFLIPFLVEAPVFYMFGLRTKTWTIFPKYNIFIEKSAVSLKCSKKEREGQIKLLCSEYVSKLEKYCCEFPYQWYNFFDFWNQ